MIHEDDLYLLNLFGMVFKSKYSVILVSSGKSCIDRFIEEKSQDNKIHLLLLDYRLSDISSESVGHKIKGINGTKVILITAYNIDETLLRDLEETHCIAKYLKEPIHLSSLIKHVEEIIHD